MQYKAVIFDLFETLITEWGHKKYTKNEMCADLGIERTEFDVYWDEKEHDRYIGSMSFEDSIMYVCNKCEKCVDNKTISNIVEKRIKTKSVCFEYVQPEVFQLLRTLKAMGMQTAIISNCSSEEVRVLKESEIYKYFDEVILSYEVHMKKPDAGIYEEAAKRLGVDLGECIFVGDGGSNELVGAKNVGMKAIQAKWYTNQHTQKRDSIEGFFVAEEPMDIIKII
ncbi:MAG: HAD family hydrolase [Lachnospiraceae bacterium]|nr:HAD family hydrolase [Lachnospiraceae bacterium]